jgi:hypothetical protein
MHSKCHSPAVSVDPRKLHACTRPKRCWGLPFAKEGTFVVTFRERNARIRFAIAPLPVTIKPFRNVSDALRFPGTRYKFEILAAAKHSGVVRF